MNFANISWFLFLTTVFLTAGSLESTALASSTNSQRMVIAQRANQKVSASEAKADQLLQQGIEQSNNYQFAAAYQSWQQALTLYQYTNNRYGMGKAALNLGLVQMILGDSEAVKALCWRSSQAFDGVDRAAAAIALSCAVVGIADTEATELATGYQNRALKMAQEARSRSAEGQVLENLASASLNQENAAKAVEYGQKSLALARLVKDQKAEGRILAILGTALNVSGQFKKSIEYGQQSLAIAQAVGDRLTEGRVLGRLGLAYWGLKETTKAIDYQQQSLAIARAIQDRITQSLALENLGQIYQATNQPEKAIQSYEQSWQVLQSTKSYSRNRQILMRLGDFYLERGDYPKALKYYEQSQGFVKNALAAAKISCRQGDTYFELDDYGAAISRYSYCLGVARKVKNQQEELRALQGLGRVFHTRVEYGEALEAYQQSLVIARQIQDRESEAKGLSFLGSTFLTIGDSTQAIEYQQKSLTLARQIQDVRGQARALNALGRTYASLENYSKALEYQQQSLALVRTIGDRKQESAVLIALGNTYRVLGNYAKALDSQQQSLSIAQSQQDNSGEIEALGALGNTYLAMGNVSQAIAHLENRLNALVDTANGKRQSAGGIATLNWSMMSDAFGDLGFAYYKAGDLPKAAVRLQDAISSIANRRGTLNDLQRVTYLENQNRYFNTLQQVLIAQNKPLKALEIVENVRSRAFLDLLVARLDPAVALSYYQAAQQQYYVDRRTGPIAPEIVVERIQQVAKVQNATLVSYSVVDQTNLFIWVVNPTGQITFRSVKLPTSPSTSSTPSGRSPSQPTRQPVAEVVAQLRLRIRGLGVQAASPQAQPSGQIDFKTDPLLMNPQLRQLHQQLIEPIADLLPRNPTERVIFVPQGPLFLVPFPALLDANGQYLIEKHTILTAPAIQVLELTHQQRASIRTSAAENILIVGNPTMPKVATLEPGQPAVALPPLPGAESEAKAIAQLFKTSFLTGNQATKATVLQRMMKARFVHLATHGLLDERNGINSAVALAPSTTDNGLLSAIELLNLKLQAELVVLSACDTGRGKVTGDGVIGLSRALISSGVPSVIVSLWSVPDSPTAELMIAFYRNLRQSSDKAQALRQAMLETKQKYPNPLAWSAFTLIGEAN